MTPYIHTALSSSYFSCVFSFTLYREGLRAGTVLSFGMWVNRLRTHPREGVKPVRTEQGSNSGGDLP